MKTLNDIVLGTYKRTGKSTVSFIKGKIYKLVEINIMTGFLKIQTETGIENMTYHQLIEHFKLDKVHIDHWNVLYQIINDSATRYPDKLKAEMLLKQLNTASGTRVKAEIETFIEELKTSRKLEAESVLVVDDFKRTATPESVEKLLAPFKNHNINLQLHKAANTFNVGGWYQYATVTNHEEIRRTIIQLLLN